MTNIVVAGGDLLGLEWGDVCFFDFFGSFSDSLCHKLGYASVT
jgi:hypothetical protein